MQMLLIKAAIQLKAEKNKKKSAPLKSGPHTCYKNIIYSPLFLLFSAQCPQARLQNTILPAVD